MTSDVIRVLHIEDDRIQQGIVSLHLLAMKECHFDIEHAAKEDEAVDAWLRGSFDLVILDHQLAEGNGVSCLRRIRQFDPVVPIIAVSGMATPEVAVELIEAGADDYLSKQNMTGNVLSQSVLNVMTRANSFRNRYSALRSTTPTRAAT
ncbi:MAG TPA: response regulator [Pirellulales bacterium]|nr:response regulator [Pirellulales bacterium]